MQGKRKKPKRETIPQSDSSCLGPCALNLGPAPSGRRRRCPDCHYCQGCSQDRCRLCRKTKKPAPRKLSVAEQIALYERINRRKRKKEK